jgi:phage shock protein PspC (stress-responsive transcriptional regulator)
MKKNISINISGIIFHIEEDGYDTLKKYLDSINKYFSTFEDSSEILADIESRIAEIFLSKLNEEKQIITADDVSALVSTMGSVSDFKAAEEQENTTSENASAKRAENFANESSATGASAKEQYTSSGKFEPSKRLMRDQKRKTLGGVCAGLGNYFNIDPLWIRLLFALFFFAYGITFIIYIIMWIVVPGSYDLDEPVTGKKMFRDPERKVIGGVSGGVAAFLGIDIVAVRVIFIVLAVAGGLGLFIYIVLWLILPEARSLTDKMQMQGEPVTLSNIESTIKKTQTERSAEDESAFTKILLFPFRLIGIILTALGKVLVPILDIIRVAIGILIVLTGMSLVFSIVVTAGILFGVFSASAFSFPWLTEFSEASPLEAMTRAFPGWTAVAAFLATITPSIFVILLGVSVVVKRIVFTAAAGWTLFVLFFISVAMLAVGVPKIVFSFKEQGEYKVENNYHVTGKAAVLQINEVGMDDYRATRLTLKGYEGKDLKLVQNYKSQGSTRAKAIENAKMVEYNVDFKDDSVLTFDSNVRFKSDAIFRAQRLDMTLFIPYNFPFRMDEGISRFITQYVDCCGMAGTDNIDHFSWKITEDGGLECINCPKSEEDNDDERRSSSLTDFNEVEITGKFDVKLTQGNDYAVELLGPEKENYNLYRSGETLVIEYRGKKKFNLDVKDLNIEQMRINITMPNLEKLEATGFGTIRVEDFTTDEIEIESRGPVRIKGKLNAQNLTVTLTGKSEAEFSGNASRLNARLEFASKLRAYNLDVVDATVEVSGASTAKVNVSGNLDIEEGMASSVDYRGNPNVVKRD